MMRLIFEMQNTRIAKIAITVHVDSYETAHNEQSYL